MITLPRLPRTAGLALCLGLALALSTSPASAQAPARGEILAAMKKATRFFVEQVSTRGGYHDAYTEDLSYGRSEHGRGPSQVEVQREATPLVAATLLEAYEATADRYYLEGARRAGLALVAGQLCSGGWDYLIEFDAAKRRALPYRSEHDCAAAALPEEPPTTLDDNVTQAAVRVLMRLDRALEFKDTEIHAAARYALDQLMLAQYPNGAWPQRFTRPPVASEFPVKPASYPDSWSRRWPGEVYQLHYTFNDNTIADAIDMMLEAARIYGDGRYAASARRGGEFLLLAQMPEPQPAWAQQYDRDMHPAWARRFEPPSVSGGESQGLIRLLVLLYRETGERRFLSAASKALDYLERSVLPPPRGEPSEIRRSLGGEPALARFYELRSNRPLYITKGTELRVPGQAILRPDGYEISYDDSSVINHYRVLVSAAGLPALRREIERAAAAGTAQRRPERLHGLSPWSGDDTFPLPPRAADASPRQIIDSLDARGAWVEPGMIGKPDLLVSVTAAMPMVLVVNGQPTQIRENDQIRLFRGDKPPLARIIRTATFCRHLATLTAALRGMAP